MATVCKGVKHEFFALIGMILVLLSSPVFACSDDPDMDIALTSQDLFPADPGKKKPHTDKVIKIKDGEIINNI